MWKYHTPAPLEEAADALLIKHGHIRRGHKLIKSEDGLRRAGRFFANGANLRDDFLMHVSPPPPHSYAFVRWLGSFIRDTGLPKRERIILWSRLRGVPVYELMDVFGLSRQQLQRIWNSIIADLQRYVLLDPYAGWFTCYCEDITRYKRHRRSRT
jgi:hypothetical protein